MSRKSEGAYWVWVSETACEPTRHVTFRHSFTLLVNPLQYHCKLSISADSRYRFFFNDHLVGRGPARSDLQHYIYETYDITSLLRLGKNAITVDVLYFGSEGPAGEMHEQPGLIAWGDVLDECGQVVQQIRSDKSWQATPDHSFHANRNMAAEIPPYVCIYGIGFGEIIDATTAHADWRPCEEVETPVFAAEVRCSHSRKWLCPSEIPSMEEKEERFQAVIRSSCTALNDFDLMIPAEKNLSFVVDAGKLTTGYPILIIENGTGRNIRLTYAESLTAEKQRLRKPDDAPGNADVLGYYDIVTCPHNRFVYQPFLLRTFRFIKVDISTGASDARLVDFSYLFSAYPLNQKAVFESSDRYARKLFDISFWTARLCAHEHYEDCPYHERLQYVGDTRIQALFSYYICGESRLAKQAIEQFDRSRIPEGLTQSRYPSNRMQVIPPFSLFWIMMIEDYVTYTGDSEMAEKMRTGIIAVLNWFQNYNRNGLVKNLPYWNFVDWCPQWAPFGMPPLSNDGISTVINLQLLAAIQSAARLFWDKENALADELLSRSAHLKSNIREQCFCKERGLYLDAPGKQNISQHANVWAILTDVSPLDEQQAIARKILTQTEMAQTSYYHTFYLSRAFAKLDCYDKVYPLLDKWKKLIDQGVTTWPETPGWTRSECHAWSAWIAVDFLTEILGIKPLASGCKKLLIKPSTCGLSFAQGRMPIRNEFVEIKWEIDKNGVFSISGNIPADCEASVVMPGNNIIEHVKNHFFFSD